MDITDFSDQDFLLSGRNVQVTSGKTKEFEYKMVQFMFYQE